MRSQSNGQPTIKTILHADLDAFYASVEQRDNPSLRGRPVLVGGGIITAASYEAKAYGVRTPMNEREARRLCPHAVTVSPRMSAYSEASKRVFAVFNDTTPMVEGLSVDEAFLDVTGLAKLAGDGPTIAATLRSRVADEVGLTLSVGVATTKFLAKVASAVSKPDGLLVVEPGRELAFLHPLPIERLWGVGPVTSGKLRQRGLQTVGDVAAVQEHHLVSILGSGWGAHVHALAHNRDARPVVTGRRRRSIGSQRSFPSGGLDRATAEVFLLEVAERVTRRMRSGDRVGRTIILRLRFGDFKAATRSRTLAQATNTTDEVLGAARTLLGAAWPEVEERGLTRVGIAVTGLSSADAVQLALPFAGMSGGRSRRNLDAAVDEITERFGRRVIERTALLGRSQVEVPLIDG